MKKNLLYLLFFLLCSFIFSSCATIVGGSRYRANVLVNGGPDADIFYNSRFVGRGNATIYNRRQNANKFSFVVKQKGCEDQTFSFNSRTFRGWACAGTIFTFTSSTIFIPYGLIVDLADGALWKPDVNDPSIVKQNYKSYQYIVKYEGCQNKVKEKIDVVYLKNGGKVRGKIIETDLKTSVKIEMKDGSIFVFKLEEIEKVGSEEIDQ
jgi:hypothetical protein